MDYFIDFTHPTINQIHLAICQYCYEHKPSLAKEIYINPITFEKIKRQIKECTNKPFDPKEITLYGMKVFRTHDLKEHEIKIY